MDRLYLGGINRVYMISFLDTFSVGLSIPLLAPYLKSLGASHLAIGLCSSLYGVAQLVSSPLVGSWSDHSGRCSPLTISLGLCSICYMMIGLSQSINFILLLRLVIGSFKHTQSLCKAVIADEVPSNQQTNAYGLLYALSSVGFVVGPAISGHLVQKSNDIAYVSAIIMVCFWLNIALVQTLPSHNSKRSLRDSNTAIHGSNIIMNLKDINWKKFKGILMLKLCLGYCTALYYNNFSLMLKEKYSLSPMYIGYIISFQASIQSLSAFILGRIQKINAFKGASRSLVGNCFIILVVSILGLYQTQSVPVLLIWLVPFSTSIALLRNLLVELLMRNTSVKERGSLLGTFNSLTGIGRLTAPLIAGIASDQSMTSVVPFMALSTATAGAVISFLQ